MATEIKFKSKLLSFTSIFYTISLDLIIIYILIKRNLVIEIGVIIFLIFLNFYLMIYVNYRHSNNFEVFSDHVIIVNRWLNTKKKINIEELLKIELIKYRHGYYIKFYFQNHKKVFGCSHLGTDQTEEMIDNITKRIKRKN